MHVKIDDYTPEEAQQELLALTIKAARRCAYDLAHAADAIPSSEYESKLFRERASLWQSIFNPTNGVKDYRHGLHNAIDNLEFRVQNLIKLCKENNIDCSEYEDFPF